MAQRVTDWRSAIGVAVISCGLVCVVGCAASGPPQSGFLDNYSNLKPADDDAPIWQYIDPSGAKRACQAKLWVDREKWRDLARYDKVIVEPTAVRLGPDARGAWIAPDRLDAFAKEMHQAFVDALEDHYPVVDEAGPGVARIRQAITDIYPRRAYDGPTAGEHPTKAYMNSTPGGAVIEGEIVDAATGERLIAVVAIGRGSYYDAIDTGEAWNDARDSIRGGALFIRHVMDAAREGEAP